METNAVISSSDALSENDSLSNSADSATQPPRDPVKSKRNDAFLRISCVWSFWNDRD